VLSAIVVRSLLRSIAAVAAVLATGPGVSTAGPQPAPDDDHRRFTIASDPLSWIVGLYGLRAGVALDDRIALHADTNYLETQAGSNLAKGYEIGLSVTLYARRAFSGPLVESGVRFRRQFEHCKGCGDFDFADINTRATTVGPEILVGWQWMIGSTFNVAVGFGLLYDLNHHPTLYTADGTPIGSAIEPDGYLRIGFAL
jgi:hypothetical protein